MARGTHRWRALGIAVGVVALVAATTSSAVARSLPYAAARAQYVAVSRPAGFGVDGTRLVWADTTEGDYDIYCCDLVTRDTRRITVDPSDQVDPAISGDVIVWTDYRNGDADIYAYDLGTGEERRLTGAPDDQTNPAVGRAFAVYEDYGNGYNPRIGCVDLDTGSTRILDTGYGVRKTRPRIAGDLVVWEDWNTNVGVKSYDLGTDMMSMVATSAAAEIQAATDGRRVAWALSNGGADLDVLVFDTVTGKTTLAASGPGEQTKPVLVNGRVWWVERPSSDLPASPAAIRGPRGAPPVPRLYADGSRTGGGSIVELESGSGTLAWLQARADGWRIGVSVGRDRSDQPLRRSMSRAAARLKTLIAGRDKNAPLADTTPPSTPWLNVVRTTGPASVNLTWNASTDLESPPVVYDIYRFRNAISLSNLGSATLATSSVTPLSADMSATAAETTQSFVYHYAVVARDSAGNTSSPSYSYAPNPHGTHTISYHCYRCHTSGPHGSGSGYGSLGAKTRYACYRCHGGTSSTSAWGVASTLNTERDQWDYSDQSATVGSRHRNTFMEANQTECDACHTPHKNAYYIDSTTGNYDAAMSYSELLRVIEATNPASYHYSTDATPTGNTFCLKCHGASQTTMDINGGTSAYVDTAGDHNSASYDASAAHGGNVIRADDTNPGIQCEACHANHASSIDRLVDYRGSGTTSTTENAQANLCFKCHSTSSTETNVAGGYSPPFSWNGRDVRSEFTSATRTSKHPTSTAASGRSTTCVSCHNLHYVRTGGSSAWDASRATDPANTKRFAATVTDQCVGCHTASPPAAAVTDVLLVPYRVGFTTPTAWPYFTGWDKSGFKTASAGHYATSGTKALCQNCHDPHASNFDGLLAWTRPSSWTTGTAGARNNTDTTLVREENLCYQCHGNGTKGKQAPGAANVASATALPYNHRPETTTGVHSDTEASGTLGTGKRHNECVDCHDPHRAKRVAGSASQDSTNSSIGGGALHGIVGVKPSFASTAAWESPTSFASTQLAGGSGDFEAYLCLKCHSSNTTFPANQTDLAREFNPNNHSWHNVLGISGGMKATFTYKASDNATYTNTWAVPTVSFLAGGMGPQTMLTCTSCHTNESVGLAKGPHGGSVQWMLDPAYPIDWKTAGLYGGGIGISTGAASDATGVICAKCHDLYPDSNDAHARSRHYRTAGTPVYCIDCHIKIPHGWKRPRLLGSATLDPPAYQTRSTGLDKVAANEDHTLQGGAVRWSSSSCDTNGCRHNDANIMYWP